MVNDSNIGQKTWYVYFLCDPDTQMPFYVGKGTGERAEQHIRLVGSSHDHNQAKKDTIQRILLAGKQMLIKRVAEFSNEQDASIYEFAMIIAYGEHLTNIQSGGIQSRIRRSVSPEKDLKQNPAFAFKPEPTSNGKIYNRLKVLRTERGMSRASLAEAIGVNYQTIGYLEREEYSPGLDLTFRISEFFGLPISAVFSRRPFNPLSEEVYSAGEEA
ncbi:MAG TPA: helix-turn-helix domain-containing protein [Ktedonobacteraceae bacterium]